MAAPVPYELPARYTPEAKDYGVDWTARLTEGETITVASVAVMDGDIAVSDVDHSNTAVTFWLTGGTAMYQRLVCIVTTSASPRPRIFEIEMTIACYP